MSTHASPLPLWRRLRPPAPQTAAPPTGLRVAHRGGLYHAPENSLEAVRCAADLGADAVELDVRLMDGGLRCAHDRGQAGPRAEDALELALKLGLRVEFDLKSFGTDGAVEAVSHMLRTFDAHERTWVSTFQPLAAWRLRWADPRTVVGWSISRSMVERAPLYTGWTTWLGAQIIEPEWGLVTDGRLDLWHRLGLVVETWSLPDGTHDDWLARGVNIVVDRLHG